jgi:flagellar biosynthesis protein FlhB
MAEDDAQDQRTEQATAHRLGKAANEGQVAVSRDVALWVGLVLGVIALVGVAGAMRDVLIRMVAAAAGTLSDPNPFRLVPYIRELAKLAMVVVVVSAMGGALAFALQTGARFWPHLVVRGTEALFSGEGWKRLFSRRMLVDVAWSLVKLLTVTWAAWVTLHDEFLTLPKLIQAQPGAQFSMLFQPLMAGAVNVLAVMAILAGLDFALTRYRHRNMLKMTKEEVRREHKEEEGDPLFRMQRRRRHRDIMKGRAAVEVPRADVLVVNPTHIAIALRYRPGKDRAPVVTAKGKGELAEFMRSLARTNGVPIVEDVPLARLLYRKVKVGRTVPADTYKAVAAILAFVYRITRRAAESRPAARPPHEVRL